MPASFLNYYRLGRRILWRGAPVRVAVRVDPVDVAVGGRRLPSVNLMLEREDGEEVLIWPESVEDGRSLFEVETDRFPAGPFSLTIVISAENEGGPVEEAIVPEEVWLLERREYGKHLAVELDEEFRESASVDTRRVLCFIEEIVTERVVEARLERDTGQGQGARLPVTIAVTTGRGDGAFALAPVRWVTEKVLAVFDELTLGGVRDGSVWFGAYGVDGTLKFRIAGNLIEPLSESAVASLKDEEFGELIILERFVAQGDIDYEVDAGRLDFEVSVGFRIADLEGSVLAR